MPRPDRFALATVRRSALPQGERNGILSPVPLEAGSGLHEPIHLQVFDDNIIGVEFNFYGPRATRLPGYLRYTLGDLAPSFVMEPLLRQDMLDRLKQQKRLRFLDLQVRSSYAAQLTDAKGSGLGGVLDAAARRSGAPVVGVTLRPAPYQKDFLPKKVLRFVKRVAADPGMSANALSFKVKGINQESGKIDTLDLLEDKLVTKKAIVRVDARSRALDSGAAYDAIEKAYAELREDLLLASSVSAVGSDE